MYKEVKSWILSKSAKMKNTISYFVTLNTIATWVILSFFNVIAKEMFEYIVNILSKKFLLNVSYLFEGITHSNILNNHKWSPYNIKLYKSSVKID